MAPTIRLSLLEHKNQMNIAIGFGFNNEVKDHIKKLSAVKWSQTHKTFYLPLNSGNKKLIYSHLRKKNWFVDVSLLKGINNIEPITKPALPQKPTAPQYSKEEKKLLNDYVSYLRGQRLGERSVRTYYNFILKFVTFNKKPIKELTTRDIELFIEGVVAKQQYSISSHRQCISALKHFEKLFECPTFNVENIKRPKKSTFLPTVLSKEETISLLQNTRNLKHRAILALTYSAGLRIGEVLNLQLSDIDITRKYVHVKQGKGRKDRYAMLAESILPLLQNYINTYKPEKFLIEGEGGQQYSQSSVRAFLSVSCKRAGITKKVTPHTLRHSFATHMLENGIGIRHIQELLGHSKPETTMIYTHVAKKDLMQIQSPLDTAVKEIMQKRKNEQDMRLSGEWD